MHLKSLLAPGTLVATLASSGCVLPPKETAHPEKLANTDVGLSGAEVQPAADGWWDSFNDPQLDRLIRLGLKDSPTLVEAKARVSAASRILKSRRRRSSRARTSTRARSIEWRPENSIILPRLAGHPSGLRGRREPGWI